MNLFSRESILAWAEREGLPKPRLTCGPKDVAYDGTQFLVLYASHVPDIFCCIDPEKQGGTVHTNYSYGIYDVNLRTRAGWDSMAALLRENGVTK